MSRQNHWRPSISLLAVFLILLISVFRFCLSHSFAAQKMYCLTNAYKNINIDCVQFLRYTGGKVSETAAVAKIKKSSLNLVQPKSSVKPRRSFKATQRETRNETNSFWDIFFFFSLSREILSPKSLFIAKNTSFPFNNF